MLFKTPALTATERSVIERIGQVRDALRHQLTPQRRWVGLLRRLSLARAIQSSNSIEGYDVTLEDAVAAVAGEPPAGSVSEAWLAVAGYTDALTYILQLADDSHFRWDENLIRSLHYMMIKHDLSKSPGRWRPGVVYVRDDRTGEIVYTGPDAVHVPALMAEFVESLTPDDALPAMVRAAMAHLNFVMVHPFRDGNGRMARCVQTLVLAREGIVAPPFWSIEEYLRANTPEYYKVLGEVGAGSWHPERDARPWLDFVLTAHYYQAQTQSRRAQEAERRWDAVAEEVKRHGLPERATSALFNATMGMKLRNASYREEADVSDTLATKDLKAITESGLLLPSGTGRKGRFYVAGPRLRELERAIREPRVPIQNPFETVAPSLWSMSLPGGTSTALRPPGERSPSSAQD